MEPRKNKVMVEILGENYPLRGDAEPERIMQVAAIVDTRMKEIARQHPKLPTAKIAVLTALNVAADLMRLESDYQQLRKMIKDAK